MKCYKKLIILLLLSPCSGKLLLAQECRDPNPKEMALYEQMIQIFDAEVLAPCRNDDWSAGLKYDGNTNTVVTNRMLPERPFTFCGFERFEVDMSRQAGTPGYNLLQDSLKTYEDEDTKLTGELFAQLNKAKPDELAAIQKKQEPLQRRLHFLRYRRGQLSTNLGMHLTTDVNAPLLIVSTPHGGFLATSCKKLSLPGVALAYLVKSHDDDMGDSYRLVVGLGKWVDDIKKYTLDDELYVHYRFVHRFPADIIESLVITIAGGNPDDLLQLARRINWAKVDVLVGN
jgi:hypothetical protein